MAALRLVRVNVKSLLFKLSLVILVLAGLPLLGVVLAGYPVSRYLEFPPATRYVEHGGFSWPVFFALCVFVCFVTAPFIIRVILTRPTPAPPFHPTLHPPFPRRAGDASFSRGPEPEAGSSPVGRGLGPWAARTPSEAPPVRRHFPWWGSLGLLLLSASWTLAWSRFPWFAPWQGFTFSPIWVGYILVINAWTYRRTGHCLLLDRPKYFLWLFPLSAGFWWYFEYLNRFVQNWHYAGIDSFSPLEYFIYATLPFSTVLPAVLSTKEWVESCRRFTLPLQHFWPVRIRHWRMAAVLAFILGGVGLVGLGIWPDALFPAVWMSPILIMASLQVLFGRRSLFAGLQHGDWRSVWVPALAGLCCGLLWELWNSKSLAHWQYAVPYVQRFSLFEMPLLGYAGYLPFGVECALIADLFLGRRP